MAQPADAGTRLDQAIARHLPEISRRRAKDLIGIGGVFVNRVRTKQSSRQLVAGDKVELHLGSAEQSVARGAPTEVELPPLAIAYEDEDVVVIDKAAGMITAPTPQSDRGNLLWYLRARARRIDRHARVFLVHRIDMPTSGLLVFAKTEAANRALAQRFAVHDIDRQYLAIAHGRPPGDRGEHGARFEMTSAIDGRTARTHAEILASHANANASTCYLRLTLYTGRTHQIRIHLAREGLPILGDPQYATPASAAFEPKAPRLMLHAAVLGFAHPRTGEALRFESAPPAEFTRYLEALGALPPTPPRQPAA